MKRLLLVLVAALALVATSCGSNGSSGESSAAAVVDGTTITIDQLNTKLAIQADLDLKTRTAQGEDEATVRKDIYGATTTSYSSAFTASVLSQMISSQLVKDEAVTRGVVPTPDDESTATDAIAQQYEGVDVPADVQDALVAEFSYYVALSTALAEDYPAPEITDEAVRSYYDANGAELPAQVGDIACLSVIVVGWSEDPAEASQISQPTAEQEADSLARAQAAFAQSQSGTSFEDLAAQYSAEPTTAAAGGKYGCLPVADFPIPEFGTAAANQAVGEVGAPVRSDYGYLILRVDSRGTSFEDVEEWLRLQLEQSAAKNYTPLRGWFTEVDAKVVVEINPQIGTWGVPVGSSSGLHQVLPPEGASTQTTVAPEGGLGEELPIDLSQLTPSGG